MKIFSSIDKNKKFRLSPDVIFRQLEKDDGILLNLMTKNYYSLNETACHIVKSLRRGSTKSIIIKSLIKKYNAPVSSIKKDVDGIFRLLAKDKILV